MARSKNFRYLYKENGENYIFDRDAYQEQLKNKGKKESITLEQIRNDIADKVNQSPDSVKKWSQGHNGPGDITIVKDIADYLEIDFHELLVLSPEDSINRADFSLSSSDEKGIIKHFHGLLSDFIYLYVAGYGECCCYSYALRHQDKLSYTPVRIEIDDYVYNLYKLLENVSLDISQDTYDKLHRMITECKSLTVIGDEPITPYLGDWTFYNERWNAANPRLSIVAESCDDSSVGGTFIRNKNDQLLDAYLEESGMAKFIKEQIEANEGRDVQKQVQEELYDEFLPPSYEAWTMEVARTLTMLFKKEFPQYFMS